MKYNICTVANDQYFDFLYYFVESALNKCNDLDKIYILYSGEKNVENIVKSSKVIIVKHTEVIFTEKIWDTGWTKNVTLKSIFLRNLSITLSDPIFLIDVDSFFLKNFIDVIDMNKDLVLCNRRGNVPYIASFVGIINPKRCIPFLDKWIDTIDKTNRSQRETPALCSIVDEIKKEINVQDILDDVISCCNVLSPMEFTRILHFKGSTIGDAKVLLGNRLKILKDNYV